MISAVDKAKIEKYIEGLNFLEGSKQELMDLLEKEEYRELWQKLDFYTQLEIKKLQELARVEDQRDRLEEEEYLAAKANEEQLAISRLSKVDQLTKAVDEAAAEEYMEKLQSQSDEVLAEAAEEIMALKNEFQAQAESEEIEKIKNKLK